MTEKIICIGASKTGTTSIKVALRMLGYNVVGWSDRAVNLLYSEKKYDVLYRDYMVKYDAFTDAPWSRMYKIFDGMFDCKFILTDGRNSESWYKSLKNHIETRNSHDNFRLIYPYELHEKEKLIEYYPRWYYERDMYFMGRKDMLYMNLFDGDGWGELCNFLNRHIPAAPFPWENRGEYK